MHLPVSALPGSALLLLDPAAQQIAAQAFAPRSRSTQASDQPEQFIAPALINSWVNFGSGYNNAGFFKDRGVVHLRGMIKSGVLTSAAFVLPVGYRPASQEFFGTVSNFAFGSVTVDAAGNVIPFNGSNTFISLDGLTFRAA